MKPKLWLMIDNSPEFEITEKLPFIEFLGIDVDTPAMSNNYQDNAGIDGSTFTTAVFNKNTVNVRLSIHSINYYDLKSKTLSINQFFYKKKIFRLRTDAEPMMVQFVRPVGFEVKPISDGSHDCLITIPFENPTGYKFSRYDSLEQLDLWDNFPLGYDLPAMDREDFHFIDEPKFDLLNPSGVPIDPYIEHHDLKVFMSWIGPQITLTNTTNGSSYTFYGENNNNFEIVLDGIETYRYGEQLNSNTDFGNLKLEAGINHIQVSGCKHFDVKFEFPFIFA